MTLYRTYRPQYFRDLVGCSTVTTLLQNTLRKNRLAHAYLFAGPRGTGKTTTARIFARAVACQSPQTEGATFEPCGTCDHCLLIARGQTPDLIEIDAASNRSIEDVRLLREQAQYPPTVLPYRMYIIDEAHMLTGDAFNALLKTLEEPPAHCLFILATTEAHKLPITVRSRCQLVRFSAGTPADIAEKLQRIVETEGLTVDTKALTLIASYAHGGFRDAETLLEQLTLQHATLTADDVVAALGTVDTHLCQTLADACLTASVTEVHTLLQEHFSDPALHYDWIITELITYLRQQEPTPATTAFLRQLLEAHILQRSSPVPSLPLHLACLTTVQAHPGIIAPPVPHEPPSPKKATPPISTAYAVEIKPQVTISPTTQVPVVELRDVAPQKDIRKAWKQAIEEIGHDALPLAQMLSQTVFHETEGNRIIIRVRYKYHVEKLAEHKNRARIGDLLEHLTGQKWELAYQLDQNLPRQENRPQIGTSDTSTVISSDVVRDVFQSS